MTVRTKEFDYRRGLDEAKAYAKLVNGELVESDTVLKNHKVMWVENDDESCDPKDAQVEMCDIYITLNSLLSEVKALRIALSDRRRY